MQTYIYQTLQIVEEKEQVWHAYIQIYKQIKTW